MEFRFNLLTWTMLNLVWFGLVFISVNLIFGQVEAIAGWTKNEVLLLVFVQQLFINVLWTLVLQNLNNFSWLVRKGELDFVLLKPVNARFWVSTRFFEFDHYLSIVVLIFLIINLVQKMAIHVTFLSWVSFLLLFFSGIFIFYNLFFMITTTNFWFINIFNLENLFDEIVDIGRFPIYIFKGSMRFFFVYILPVAFIATFPVQFLLGRGDVKLILFGLLLGITTFTLSEWFWRFALKRYSSASS